MQKIKLKRMPKSALLIIIEGSGGVRARKKNQPPHNFFHFGYAEVIIFCDVARFAHRICEIAILCQKNTAWLDFACRAICIHNNLILCARNHDDANEFCKVACVG